MIYERLLRRLLFALDPETAHHLALACLRRLPAATATVEDGRISVFGLRFRHRIGLAAGFDKNGLALPAWERLGFAFAEIGTVTAQPQPGNPRPRIFRYPRQQALINRLGFNNDGADAIAERLEQLRERGKWPRIPIGINIGKSRAVPLERAVEDYTYSYHKLRPHADYIALNVSSPNTPGLRELQRPEQLAGLLCAIEAKSENRPPLLVKIAPDLDAALLNELVDVCETHNVDGIIATNTTLDHSAIPPGADEEGGLSGAPLRQKSTAMIARLAHKTKMPIIGCGGVFDLASAQEKLEAGATLLQLYTGFVYRGPGLIRELAKL
jgi:dihydroorotate dehydrogenase